MKTKIKGLTWLFAAFMAVALSAEAAASGGAVPWALPWGQPWTITLPAPPPVLAPPMPVVAPDVYRDHALERHGADAVRAREAAKDPKRCDTYKCDSSRSADNWLRICTIPGDPAHIAVQWLFEDGGKTYEATSFIQRTRDREYYLRKNGCRLTA